jgi:hypothetical protein
MYSGNGTARSCLYRKRADGRYGDGPIFGIHLALRRLWRKLAMQHWIVLHCQHIIQPSPIPASKRCLNLEPLQSIGLSVPALRVLTTEVHVIHAFPVCSCSSSFLAFYLSLPPQLFAECHKCGPIETGKACQRSTWHHLPVLC